MLTFGHGRLTADELVGLLQTAGVELVVDVRRFPGSRTNPAAARGAVPEELAAAGIDYRWEERLGGRRPFTAAQDAESPDTWWKVKAFRAYAAWTRSPDFRAGLATLVSDLTRPTAIMCSESVWWRCHRRIIADVLTLGNGVAVDHLFHDGRLEPHTASDGARLVAGGLVWDGAASA